MSHLLMSFLYITGVYLYPASARKKHSCRRDSARRRLLRRSRSFKVSDNNVYNVGLDEGLLLLLLNSCTYIPLIEIHVVI